MHVQPVDHVGKMLCRLAPLFRKIRFSTTTRRLEVSVSSDVQAINWA